MPKKKFADIERKIKFHKREITKEKEKLLLRLNRKLPEDEILDFWFKTFFVPNFFNYILYGKGLSMSLNLFILTARKELGLHGCFWQAESLALFKNLSVSWQDYLYFKFINHAPIDQPGNWEMIISAKKIKKQGRRKNAEEKICRNQKKV